MLEPRPPIITILGHVDHGKTSLLDFIRKSSVVLREHGGITQHIGAYQVEIPEESKSRESEANRGILRLPSTNAQGNNPSVAQGNNPSVAQDDLAKSHKITFIDTPGHAAFEKMRSRGAKVADIAVLVVAVDDGVMPQTVEAIKHILEAKIPMVVALNKIDLPGIDIKIQTEKVKKQLSDQKVLVEEYGGDVPIVPVSAKTGVGVDKLLEMILLMAELSELKGDPSALVSGVVIEANLDRFKGPIATLIIRNGTLKKGEQIVLGGVKGKIRGMFDFTGKPIESAGPSAPVEILGLEAVPQVGVVMGEEAKEKVKPEIKSLLDKLRQDKGVVLNVVVKADKQGSLEAIEEALLGFNSDPPAGGEHVKIISSGTGGITEADIKLAVSTRSIVIGFNSTVAPTAQKIAENEHVLVRTYTIIYELIDEIKQVVEEMLKVGAIEEIFGTAQIVAEFPYGKNERIAGCKILDGNISKGPKARVVREDPSTGSGQLEVIGEMKIRSMKKVKEEVVKVEKGDECGMMFEPQVDFQIGDLVQSFRAL